MINNERGKSPKHIEERELCSVRLKEICNKADSPCESFVEAEWSVRCPCPILKLRRLQELGKSRCAMEIELVACETVEQQEDVAATCHTVADARTFLQQTTLPRQISTALTRCKVASVIRPRQVGLGEQVHNT